MIERLFVNSFCHQLVYSFGIYKGKSLNDVTSCDIREKMDKKKQKNVIKITSS
jgi:hypothetical protein